MNNLSKNVVLTGMSGAGKSTLGVLLAKALGFDFTDTDIVIQRNSGRSLQSIIDEDGIDGFLQLEGSTVASLRLKGCVIATGGSVVYSDEAMKKLKKNGTIVYLELTYPEIEARLKDITTRGIVMKPGESLYELYTERLPLYRKYADITVNCSGKTVEDNLRQLINRL